MTETYFLPDPFLLSFFSYSSRRTKEFRHRNDLLLFLGEIKQRANPSSEEHQTGFSSVGQEADATQTNTERCPSGRVECTEVANAN